MFYRSIDHALHITSDHFVVTLQNPMLRKSKIGLVFKYTVISFHTILTCYKMHYLMGMFVIFICFLYIFLILNLTFSLVSLGSMVAICVFVMHYSKCRVFINYVSCFTADFCFKISMG